jgi:hydrogenase maturation protease
MGLQPQENCTSLHQMHFIEAVKMVNLLGHYPQIIVYGIEPAVVDWGLELTPRVAEKLPRLTELIAQEIRELMAQ